MISELLRISFCETHHSTLRKMNRLLGNSTRQLKTSLSLGVSPNFERVHFHTILSICFFSPTQRTAWLVKRATMQPMRGLLSCSLGRLWRHLSCPPHPTTCLPQNTHKHKFANESCHDIIIRLANLTPLQIHTV